MNYSDTIAAIATPIGEGGIGIIRISGPAAAGIAGRVLRTPSGKQFSGFKDHYLNYGRVIDPATGRIIDEALFFYAAKPRSFTAEDVMEIQVHGGLLLLQKILATVIGQGARLAEPGEFTLRAFLNGRIDLIQAESVIDLIRAQTDKAHELALAQLSGGATREINRLETELYQILIAIEAVLDYPEEGLPEPEMNEISAKVNQIKNALALLLKNSDEGRKIRDGITVTIIGRPNVGKSSLLNAFLREEKAIVTEIPGTTRDIIEAQIQLRGIPVRLIDTAGVRTAVNPIEQIGIAKAEHYIAISDLILLVLDGSEPLSDADRLVISKIEARKVLPLINKTDLPKRLTATDLPDFLSDKALEVSTLTEEGFSELEEAIVNLVGIGELRVDDRPLLSRVRHKNALEDAIAFLRSFQNGFANGISEDLLAVDLRACLAAMGEITGKNVGEEVLRGIFANFCIGK